MSSSLISEMLSTGHDDSFSPQMQSPFFRKIPAEIRQEIYSFYTLEKHGYFYNTKSGRLSVSSTEDGEETSPIRLDLMYTCKAVNKEMSGIALRENKVTFSTGDYQADSNFYESLKSKAARWKLLLSRIATTRRQMLFLAEDCVTDSMLDQVLTDHGSEGQYLTDAFKAVKADREGRDAVHRLRHDGARLLGKWNNERDVDPPAKFQQALQHLIQLASDNKDFRQLAMKAFDSNSNASRNWTTLFKPGAYTQVLSWTPEPWTIPSEADLVTWEDLFIEVEHPSPLKVFEEEDSMLPFKWYFSAAAIAIDFIDRHRLGSQVRQIALIEDRISVSNPECHAQGLVQLCTVNPMAKISRSVSTLSGLFPRGWRYLPQYMPCEDPFRGPEDEPNEGSDVRVEVLLQALVPWLDEASALFSQLPSKPFKLEFDGPPGDTLFAWDTIKEAAALQAANIEYYRCRGIHTPLPSQCRTFQNRPYPLPCHLPVGFLQVVKNIILDKMPGIRFSGSTCWTLDLDEIMRERENWSAEDWERNWRSFIGRSVELPEAGLRARISKYLVDPNKVISFM